MDYTLTVWENTIWSDDRKSWRPTNPMVCHHEPPAWQQEGDEGVTMAVRGSEDTGPQLKLDATSQAISGWIAGDWEFNVSFRPKMARSWHPLLKASYDPR